MTLIVPLKRAEKLVKSSCLWVAPGRAWTATQHLKFRVADDGVEVCVMELTQENW